MQRQWSDLDADLRICNFSNRYYELKTYLFKKNTHTVPRKEHSIKSFNDFIRNRLWILVYFHFQHTVCDPNSIQRISHAFFLIVAYRLIKMALPFFHFSPLEPRLVLLAFRLTYERNGNLFFQKKYLEHCESSRQLVKSIQLGSLVATFS